MKLLAVFAATVACVSAGTFVSPTNGSTISPSGTFNFTWVSSRYFKESSRSVTVLLGENLEGVVLAKNLASTAQGEGAEGPTYHAQLTPEFVASSPPGGNYQVIVIEDYSSYGMRQSSNGHRVRDYNYLPSIESFRRSVPVEPVDDSNAALFTYSNGCTTLKSYIGS